MTKLRSITFCLHQNVENDGFEIQLWRISAKAKIIYLPILHMTLHIIIRARVLIIHVPYNQNQDRDKSHTVTLMKELSLFLRDPMIRNSAPSTLNIQTKESNHFIAILYDLMEYVGT